MSPDTHRSLRTAILISGSGTTMEAVLKASERGELPGIVPTIVIASRAEAKGIQKAQSFGVLTEIIERKKFANTMAFGEELLRILKQHEIELVSQNGWLPLTPLNVVSAFEGRLINQHPGPLDSGRPDFGGKGMYGERVIAARIAYSWLTGEDWWTEATVHFVNEKFDEGELLQTTRLDIHNHPNGIITLVELQNESNIKLLKKLTTEVHAELLPLEHTNVITALQKFSSSTLPKGFKRTEPLVKPENYELLKSAKELVVKIFK